MATFKKGLLKKEALIKLKDHKYNASGTSLLEPLLQPFWKWLVEKLPLWVAPNTITIVGLILNIASTLFLMYYSPNGNSQIPPWALIVTAICLFTYQALDAIDGKQARRTNSSSPLGELFDHGCDAISTVFVTLGSSLACGLGEYPGLFLFQSCYVSFLFYCAHWQVYVTGQMRFAIIDVVEAQLSIMSILFITAFMGVDFWTIPFFGAPLKLWMLLASILASFPLTLRLAYSCVRRGAGKNGATVANTSVVFPGLPIFVLLFLCFSVANKSPSDVFGHNSVLFITTFCMSMVKVTQKLVVAQMTKSEMTLLDTALIGPLLLFLNQYFDCRVNEYFVLCCCCVLSVVDVIKYSMDICSQISEFMGICVFSITRARSSGVVNSVPNPHLPEVDSYKLRKNSLTKKSTN